MFKSDPGSVGPQMWLQALFLILHFLIHQMEQLTVIYSFIQKLKPEQKYTMIFHIVFTLFFIICNTVHCFSQILIQGGKHGLDVVLIE